MEKKDNEVKEKHDISDKAEFGNHVPIESEYHLVEGMEKMLNGKSIRSLNLAVNGVEKFCHMLQPLLIHSHLAGGKPTAWRPPCNNRCSQFKVIRKKEGGPNGETIENHYVQLSCGAGVLHRLMKSPPATDEGKV